ncbi:MAG: PPC domain-containing protein [Verrucomicrobiota bacterium]
MKHSRVLRLLWIRALCVSAFAPIGLSAQPVPKLMALSRDWFQRGTTNEVVISGEHLRGAKAVRVSGDGGLAVLLSTPDEGLPKVTLEASKGGISVGDSSESKAVRATVTISDDASLNPREIRLVTAEGVSNPVIVNVSPIPEILETSGGEQRLSLPVGLSGTIAAPGEQDSFTFDAKKGQELIFEILAFRSGSALDSSMALLNSKGLELARSEDAKGFDSFIRLTVPEDGAYRLQIRDFRYGGSSKHTYHLTAGALPYVDWVYPAGVSRGQSAQVRLHGANLGVDTITLRPDLDAPLGWQEVRVRTSNGLSTPFRFEVGELPEFMETEPNGGTNQANVIRPPTTVNGRISAPRDVDQFKFKLSKSQRLICEITAQRFGSPLDAVLVLRDGEGHVLSQNDDAEGADARIDYPFEKDKEYLLSVRDLLGRGPENAVYRLALRPPQPDFTVRFFPDAPRINCGGRAIVRCEVLREAGFGGAVRIVAENLPAGVTAEPVLMTADDPTHGLLILNASGNAAGGVHPLRLAATGLRDGAALVHSAEPMAGDTPAREGLLTILDSAPPFTLELLTLSVSLEQEQAADLQLLVRRRDGFDGEIKLTPEGFSSGRESIARNLEFQPVTLKAAESRARLTCKARMDSEIGVHPIYVRAETTVDGQTINQYSQAVPLTIRQLPFSLVNTMKRLSVAVLPAGTTSAASEAEFAVRASRRGWFTDQIDLSLEGLPEGVTATTTNLASHVGEVTFKLHATEKAAVLKDFEITVVGSANIAGRIYQQRTAPMTLSVTKPTEVADSK